MSDMHDLYQEIIIDHGRNPRNKHPLPGCNHQADGYNPLCGDKLTVYIKTENDVIADISFAGEGCAISMASSSLMCEKLRGMRIQDAEELFKRFQLVLTTDAKQDTAEFGKLEALLGVKQYPMRVKCATLAWHTMHNALLDDTSTAKTE